MNMFIAWGREAELSRYLAQALGADFKKIYFKKFLGINIPAFFRYIIQGAKTVILLVAKRPKVLIVQNPPVFLPLLALVYCRVFGVKLMIDSHTAAFGDRRWIFFHGLFKWVARRVDLNTCHNYKNLEILKKWGAASAMVLQFFNPEYDNGNIKEPMRDEILEAVLSKAELPVMMVNRFADDDDWRTVLETAELMPEADFFITGRPTDAAKKAVAKSFARNFHFTGYLDHEEFMKLMNRASVVLALTLRSDTVLWSIREIMALRKPFIATDSEVLRHYFGDVALFSDSDAREMRTRIKEALATAPEFQKRTEEFLKKDKERWQEEITRVKEILNIDKS